MKRLPGIYGQKNRTGAPVEAQAYGMNLSAVLRRFNNILTGSWNGDTLEGQFTATPYPNINENGEIVSFPSGVTSLYKGLPWPNGAGVKKKFRLSWTGAHTTGASGTVRLVLLGNASRITNVTYGTGYIEFDFEVPDPFPSDSNTSIYVGVFSTGFNPADPIRNLDCREIVTAGGAVVDSGTWHVDFINYIKNRGERVIRLMDLMLTNGNIFQSGTGAFTWSMRSQSLTRCPSRRARLGIGTLGTNNFLRIRSPDYLRTDENALGAILPNHGFGSNGNDTTIQIVAGAGALSVSASGTGNKDILITLAAGGSTVAAVKAAIEASSVAFTRIVPDKPTSWTNDTQTDGLGLCATLAKTNLADGYDGSGRDGPPLSALIELANLTGCRPWFNIPVNADATYATNFATQVNAGLSAACKPAIFELGNEVVWNFSFPASGWVAGWGVAHGTTGGSIGETGAKEYSNRIVAVMPAIKAVMGSDCIVLAGSQAANTTYDNYYIAANASFVTSIEGLCIAPYFYPGGDYAGEVNDPTWFAGCISSINSRWGDIGAHQAIISPYSLRVFIYEGGQHDDKTSDLTDMQRRQRSTMIRFLYGYYFGEGKRRYGVGSGIGIPFCHYSDIGGIATGQSGAWGMQEYRDQPRAEAPKYDAYLNAIAGIFPPYMIYPNKPSATGTRTVGSVLTVTIPAFYYVASATIQAVRDGTPIGSPSPLIVYAVPKAQTWSYTQVAGDATHKMEFRVVLTNAQGEANFIDYISTDNLTTS